MGNKRSCNGVHVQNILVHLSMLVAPVRWLIAEIARNIHLLTRHNNNPFWTLTANQQLVISLTKILLFFSL